MKNFALVMFGFGIGAIWGAYETVHAAANNQAIRKAMVSEAADWIINKLNL